MFYERLKTLCKENGTSVSAMLKELSLSTGSTGAWKKGQLPKGETLAAIADYLHTSIDYLVFGECRCNLNEEQLRLLELYESTPDYARYKALCDFEDSVNREIEKLAAKKDA